MIRVQKAPEPSPEFERLRSRIWNYPEPFMDNELWITNKQSERVRMAANWTQHQLDLAVKKMRMEGRPVRIGVIKSRQRGVTTREAGRMYVRTRFKDNVKSYIGAHLKETAEKIMDKIRYFEQQLDPALAMDLEKFNHKEVKWKWSNSAIYAGTTRTKAAGRSPTYTNVLLTEAGYYPYFGAFKGGIEAAVPQNADSSIIIESTTNGVGGEFYDFCQEAWERKSNYTLLFLPWPEDPECEYLEILEWDRDTQEEYFEEAYSRFPTLEARAEHFNLSPVKVAFYYEQLKFYNDELLTQQEYPCSFEEAFVATGKSIFSVPLIERYRMHAAEQPRFDPHRHWLNLDDLKENPYIRPNQDTYIEIFETPKQYRRYVLAADPASGQGGEYNDYACGMVFDVLTQNLCAVLHGRLTIKQFAPLLKRLAICYNMATIVPEVTGPGIHLKDELADIYLNIYMRRRDKGYSTERIKDKLGWVTDRTTRKRLIQVATTLLTERLDDAAAFIPDKYLLNEMMTFVEREGKPQAAKGCHDDRVLTWMIGIYTCFHEMDQVPEISIASVDRRQREVQLEQVKSGERVRESSDIIAAISSPAWIGQSLDDFEQEQVRLVDRPFKMKSWEE